MDKKRKNSFFDSELIFLLVVMAIGVFFLVKAMLDFSGYNYKVRVFPMATAGAVILFCVIELVRSLIQKSAEMKKENSEGKKCPGIKSAMGFLWLLFIPVFTWLFGFYVSTPLFSFLFLKSKRIKWIPSIIIAVIMFLIMYFLFGQLLRVRIYTGILF